MLTERITAFFRSLTTLLQRDERSAYDEATALPPIVYSDYAHMPDARTARERFDLCFAARVDHAEFEKRQAEGQRIKDRWNTQPMQFRVLVRPSDTLRTVETEIDRLQAKNYNAVMYYSPAGAWATAARMAADPAGSLSYANNVKPFPRKRTPR